MENRFVIPPIERIFKQRFSLVTHVELLWKGRESFQTIFDAVHGAEKLICLQFYIFKNDETGIALSELLKQKKREGVEVYLLYDHFGSLGTPRKFWKAMSLEGIKILASHPFKWSPLSLCPSRSPKAHCDRLKTGLHGRAQHRQ